jgi:preprotein translocase subunit SecE
VQEAYNAPRNQVVLQGGVQPHPLKASSSIGRAFVSKTNGCGFKSCLACRQATPLYVGRRFSRKKLKEFILAEKAKSKKVNPITGFFRETTGELKKVTWPTWPEARQLTGLVLLVMVVIGIILGLTDAGAHGLLNLLLAIK